MSHSQKSLTLILRTQATFWHREALDHLALSFAAAVVALAPLQTLRVHTALFVARAVLAFFRQRPLFIGGASGWLRHTAVGFALAVTLTAAALALGVRAA